MEVSAEMEKILTVLSDKFGTTAEYLWEVLITQNVIMGWSWVCASMLLFVVSPLVFIKTYRKCRSVLRHPLSPEDGAEIKWIILTVVLVCCLIPAIICFGGNVTRIVNPEYWALHEILGAM